MSIDYVLTFYLLKDNDDVMISMSSRKWECVCGYTSNYRQGLHQHRKTCKTLLGGETEQLKNQVAQMKEQLEAKDQQLAAKDRQIEQLIKRPRTVNNTTHNKYVVEQHINVFGKESIEHISHEQIQALLADPANAVPPLVPGKVRDRNLKTCSTRCGSIKILN